MIKHLHETPQDIINKIREKIEFILENCNTDEYQRYVKKLLELTENCQVPLQRGGDFHVSADESENTTVQDLTKHQE